MCLTRIARIHSLPADGEAVVDLGGRDHVVSLAPLVLEGREVGVGDWVLIHTGLAVERVDEATAREMLEDLPHEPGPGPLGGTIS